MAFRTKKRAMRNKNFEKQKNLLFKCLNKNSESWEPCVFEAQFSGYKIKIRAYTVNTGEKENFDWP